MVLVLDKNNKSNSEIEILNGTIKLLERENEDYIKDISFLKSIVENLIKKNEEYLEKYNDLKNVTQDSDYKSYDYSPDYEINKSLMDEIKNLTNELTNLKKRLIFSNFNKFLCNSYVSPRIDVPFSKEQKEYFRLMELISKYLINNLSKLDKKPLVSVIMPVYNREEVVQEAIDSVINQSYSNFELIIVDDGSTDGTKEILENISDKRVKIFFNEKNMGASFTRNYGLKESSGEYIAYLDSDNDWKSNYLSAMVGAFLELPDADALYSGQILFKKFDSNPIGVRFGSFNKSLLHNKNYIDMNCFCHKKEVYDKIGGFNTKLKRLVDWDFILKVSNNFKIYSIPILSSNYYSENATNRIDSLNIDKKKYIEYILDKNNMKSLGKKLNRDVEVVIYNQESLEQLNYCLNTIFSLDLNLKIIIINNNNEENLRNYLKSLMLENELITVITVENGSQNSFYICDAINLTGVDSDVLLLDSNAILTNNSIETMQYYAYNLEKCGLIVPQQVLAGGNKEINHHVPYADYFYGCDVNISYIHDNIYKMPVFHDGNVLKLNFAPFFCTYLKRDVLENLGEFIEDYNFFNRLFSEYIIEIMCLNIYHVSNVIVKNCHDGS